MCYFADYMHFFTYKKYDSKNKGLIKYDAFL